MPSLHTCAPLWTHKTPLRLLKAAFQSWPGRQRTHVMCNAHTRRHRPRTGWNASPAVRKTGHRGGRAVVWSLVCHVNLFRLRWLLLYRFLACVHVCKRITMYHASPMHPLPNVFVYKQPDGRKKYMVWRVLPKKETNGLNVFCLPTSTKTQPGDCVPT